MGTLMPTPNMPSSVVQRSLRRLGEDIRIARKRRNLTMQVVAERALASRKTVARIENGDPGVNIGTYASVLHALGLLDRLTSLVDPAQDALGTDLDIDALPQRVRPK